jgi:RNA:NAD 2'-phosphotransferase (TPT1/KptA family)
MLLYHATPSENLESIGRSGLCCSRSQGKMKVVWLHTPDRSAWAMIHTVRRHGGRVQDVVVLEVDVCECAVRRHASGLYYHLADVLPGEITGMRTFEQMSRSPVEEG